MSSIVTIGRTRTSGNTASFSSAESASRSADCSAATERSLEGANMTSGVRSPADTMTERPKSWFKVRAASRAFS